MTWPSIAERLAPARSYWLNTVDRDGGPHVVPVWGAVLSGVWYSYTERSTSRARNLAGDPRVAVHLDDAEDVLIVHGTLVDIGPPNGRSDVVKAFAAKYTRPDDVPFLPSSDPAFDVLVALRPTRALAWRLSDYENSHRRWRIIRT
ncbi:pyridoxamine 5'-phosphate oxidase family protein [uncultured Jatrophihabitans sp.]|uniref:pyridoxamine 5'-phosphate oxidase family protein n=1 Tax=uncultured Jatrophihabitans sp. TaxID=1610747 RepID=UPI0035C9FA12